MAFTITVRPAEASDLDTLVRFSLAMAEETESRVLDTPRLRRGLQAILDDPVRGFFRVAQVDGAHLRSIVGQMMITYEWSDWRNGTFWWIQSVYVDPVWRRRGVYRALHESIRREARSTKGVCGLRLYVEQANRSAQRTYRKIGMAPVRYRVFEEDFVLSPFHLSSTRNGPRRPRRGVRSR